MIDVAVTFVASLVASLVAVVLVLLVERARKPKLVLEIEDPPITRTDGRRFLRIRVRNVSLNRILGFFVSRHPALMCNAFLTFLNTDNQPIYRRELRMIGRWSRTPEPVSVAGVDASGKALLVRDLTRTTDQIGIPPDSYEVLDVVVRSPDEESCYGWHNAWIENKSPQPDDVFKLEKGRYHVLVRVRTGGEEVLHIYRIVNDVSLPHFRLEEVSPQPKVDNSL